MNRVFSRPGWAVFLAIVILATAVNARFIFATPQHEVSDLAVNALQIDQAKHLREIHGNYSRFNFDHPGPAFFYVYALGEAVFYDALHLTASPAGAHLLAGLVLQASFYALALALLGRLIRAPLFLPLALLAGAVHFGLATHIFLSIWPPHVLVMPFLACWAAAVAVAAGRGQDLPWLVLSGCFLVHGHASQPLFATGLFLAAYACLAWKARPAPPWRTWRRAHLLSLAILALFLLPLLLDLAQGRQSNFAAILRHLRFDETERKPLSDSLLYFLTFFGYRHDQEYLFDPAAPSHVSFLRQHGWIWAGWAGALVLALAACAGKIGNVSGPTRRVTGTMLGFWGLAAALCLAWGVLQTGPMFEFNGYFYYGVVYALILVFCALLAEVRPWPRPRLGAALLLAAAVVAGGFALRLKPDDNPAKGIALRDSTIAALRADPRRDQPKLLVFAHDDWSSAASAGLALERAGATFYVAPAWDFMFQRAHEAPRALLLDPVGPLSVWRLVHSVPPGSPSVRLTDELRIIFLPAALAPENGVIDFSRRGHLEWYALCGIVTPDSDSTWTDSPDVALQFRAQPAARDVILRLEANPFIAGRKVPDQPVEVRFNGVLVGSAVLTQPGVVRAVIPPALWNRRPVALLHFHLPHARSPATLGLSGDPRQLGLSLIRLTTGP